MDIEIEDNKYEIKRSPGASAASSAVTLYLVIEEVVFESHFQAYEKPVSAHWDRGAAEAAAKQLSKDEDTDYIVSSVKVV